MLFHWSVEPAEADGISDLTQPVTKAKPEDDVGQHKPHIDYINYLVA